MIQKTTSAYPFSQFKSFGAYKTKPASEETKNRLRYHTKKHEVKPATRNLSLLGSLIGTAGALLYLAKKQGKDLNHLKDILDVHYSAKNMCIMGGSSIVGGVIGGMSADSKDDDEAKIHEGVFQFLNIALPSIIVEQAMNFIENHKALNKTPVKLLAIGTGIVAGMGTATVVANRFNDPNNVLPDRELTAKDAIANLDDAIGALVLAKFPIASKLQFHRVVPAIFSWCGFRAGQSN